MLSIYGTIALIILEEYEKPYQPIITRRTILNRVVTETDAPLMLAQDRISCVYNILKKHNAIKR